MKLIRLHNAVEKLQMSWPVAIKVDLANLLALLAAGESLGMPVSRPMPSVGVGVHELRIKDRTGQYRVFYYTKHRDAILVFHFFRKKTQETPRKELDVGRRRLKDML